MRDRKSALLFQDLEGPFAVLPIEVFLEDGSWPSRTGSLSVISTTGGPLPRTRRRRMNS